MVSNQIHIYQRRNDIQLETKDQGEGSIQYLASDLEEWILSLIQQIWRFEMSDRMHMDSVADLQLIIFRIFFIGERLSEFFVVGAHLI